MLKRMPFLLFLGIFIISFVLRLPGLGNFMTADEPNWMVRSGQFYHNLFRGDFGGTFATSHPGVMTMWLSGAGVVAQEAILHQSIDQSNLINFRFAATFPIVVAVSLLIGLVAWLVFKLWGLQPGMVAGILLAVDPYIVGMSQISHLDALLSLFMLTSVLFVWLSVKQGRFVYLVLGSVFACFALLNKFLPALWLLPSIFALVFFVTQGSLSRKFTNTIRMTSIAVGITAIIAPLLWPALWGMHNVDQYIAQDAAIVATSSNISLEQSSDSIEPITFYVRTVAARVSWIVLLASVILLATGGWRRVFTKDFALLVVYVLGFVVLISLAAKKADRYVLPALVVIPILVGYLAANLRHRFVMKGIGILGVLAAIYTFILLPYKSLYANTWWDTRPYNQQGWGEGLDEAAKYLNQHALGDKLTVASWYPSVFGTYFKGKTFSLSSLHDDRVGYVVTYRNMIGRERQDIASNVLDEFANKQPEKIISWQGTPYVWIYNTIGLPYFDKIAGEITDGVEVGQTIPVTIDNWQSLSLGFATYSSRSNIGDVVVHIKENADATTDLRTVTLKAGSLQDSEWQYVTFEHISDSSGRTFYLGITSRGAAAGQAVTIKFSPIDVRPGQMLLRRELLKNGRNSQYLRAGDIAYRLD